MFVPFLGKTTHRTHSFHFHFTGGTFSDRSLKWASKQVSSELRPPKLGTNGTWPGIMFASSPRATNGKLFNAHIKSFPSVPTQVRALVEMGNYLAPAPQGLPTSLKKQSFPSISIVAFFSHDTFLMKTYSLFNFFALFQAVTLKCYFGGSALCLCVCARRPFLSPNRTRKVHHMGLFEARLHQCQTLSSLPCTVLPTPTPCASHQVIYELI